MLSAAAAHFECPKNGVSGIIIGKGTPGTMYDGSMAFRLVLAFLAMSETEAFIPFLKFILETATAFSLLFIDLNASARFARSACNRFHPCSLIPPTNARCTFVVTANWSAKIIRPHRETAEPSSGVSTVESLLAERHAEGKDGLGGHAPLVRVLEEYRPCGVAPHLRSPV